MLVFLANQISHVRKALLESNQITNTKTALTLNPNVAFFFSLPPHQCCNLGYLLNPLIHRNISLVKPNQSKILEITCKCKGYESELGVKTVTVC